MTDTVDVLRARAEDGVRAMVALAGVDPDREGVERTPQRVVDAFLELTSAPGKPSDLLSVVFPEPGYDQMVAVGPIMFTSMCEHHLLPFEGSAWVAYIPAEGRVVGLSKLARLVEHHARQLQLQERLTSAVADDVETFLAPLGVGVAVKADHSCVSTRGARNHTAGMVTSVVRGAIRDEAAAREEFFSLMRSG